MRKMHVQLIHNNRLRLRNRTFLQWVTLLVAFWSVIFKPVSYFPGALSYFKYVPDAIVFALLIMTLRRERVRFRRDMMAVVRIAIGFFFYTLLIYMIQYQSVAYFLWGFRNNFRFYIAFFAFVAYLDERDITTWFNAMNTLFWVNAALSVFQFFALGIKGDYLGGIFGILGASNGYTLCFMSVVLTKSLLDSFAGRTKLTGSMAKCVVAIIVAVMAEMRFFFFVMLFLTLFAAVITNFSIKKLVYILLALGALVLGASVLADMFDFQGFFTLEELWLTATQENYSSKGDVNRLTAIGSISTRLDMTLFERLFGYGLGNCDTSAFPICNTPFFVKYGHWHYHWFVSSMIFLETGYVGLVIYTLFILACLVSAYKMNKKEQSLYAQLSIIISVLCLVLMFYDSSLRIESGYMMYFVLALPFMRRDSKGRRSTPLTINEKEVRRYEQ